MEETTAVVEAETVQEPAESAAPEGARFMFQPVPATAELIQAVLRPGFSGVLDVAGYKLQMGFMALSLVGERFGSYEAMGARLTKAAEAGDATEMLLTLVKIADTCLQAAMLRHHPEHTDDDLEAVFEALGSDAASVVQLVQVLMAWWKDRDGIGSYVVGIDPTVTLGEKTYTLKWGLRAVRHVSLAFHGKGEIEVFHYRETLVAMLLRFHADVVGSLARFHGEAVPSESMVLLDDLGLVVGLGGLRRLMAGAEQPRRRPQEAGLEAPTAAPSPAESGTGPIF